MYTRAKSLLKKIIPKRLFEALVNQYHWVEVLAANIRLGFPARGLKIIGVTGTSGKSTTCAMLSHILNYDGKKTAHFTTTNAFWGGQERDNISGLTTETPMNLYSRLKQAKKAGDEYVVLESSAHAVVQHRLAFINYRGAVFTNLSHDHLDYFGTMEKYAAAKQGLFKLAAKRGGYGVFNKNDEYTPLMRSPIDEQNTITFAVEGGDVHAENVREEKGVSMFTVCHKDAAANVSMRLTGIYNVENALAAVACSLKEGVSLKQAAAALSEFSGVKGRMERFTAKNGAQIVVDFAHTPDAFELVLSSLRRSTKGKLITVFGGYGDRDKTIRPPFGKISSTYADHIILTEDTVGSETVESINNDIKQGIVKDFTGEVEEIEAREDAIKRAVSIANKGDTIALLGKGHEREIKRYPKSKPWDEIQAVKDATA